MNNYILKCVEQELKKKKLIVKITQYKKFIQNNNVSWMIKLQYDSVDHYLYIKDEETNGVGDIAKIIKNILNEYTVGVQRNWRKKVDKYYIIASIITKDTFEKEGAEYDEEPIIYSEDTMNAIMEKILSSPAFSKEKMQSYESVSKELYKYIINNITAQDYINY